MKEFIRIGIDLAKNYFQVHALESEDGRATTRKLSRQAVRKFFSETQPCGVGMEACGSAHYGARELLAMGHEVRLIPPIYVKPYVKRGKNDAADAAAVCEALSRPEMRFVPVKSAAQQADLMLHKTRELLVAQRTTIGNAVRGHLAEFGLIAAKGIGCVADLIATTAADTTLPIAAKAALRVLARQLAGIEKSIAELDAEITAAHQQNPVSRLLASIPGIGTITASAIAASVPDPHVFKSGRDFSAWLGLTPRQNSSGGKERLGAITKQGNRYIRRLLVLGGAIAVSDCGGATALLGALSKRKGPLHDWYAALLARRPARLASVAMANKLARIAFAMMATGEAFRTETFERA